ncbi:MAG: hypothetical protein C0623_11555 [Desulfuromonas sp.]|nr:MAG: hypothetical protein C0623_11555 [Desulfuromonas sp.]
MVIQCSSCDTRFKLADDKIKPGGVKVRCSKCKEVFTVTPPEEEAAAEEESSLDLSGGDDSAESPGTDWSDLNSDSESGAEESSSEDEGGIDWSDMGGDDAAEDQEDEGSSDDFSFGDDTSTETGNISFDDNDNSDSSSVDFGFDEPSAESSDEDFGFDSPSSDSDSADDDFGFDEPVGAGAQDEFSFDDDAGGSPAASVDAAPDFDWDGNSGESSGGNDDFDFGDADSSGDGDMDFSSVALENNEESPAPQASPPEPEPSSLVAEDAEKPLSAKGPQKRTGAKKSRKKKKKKSGAMRGFLFFILFILLLAGGHAGILYWKGYWKGDPTEFTNMDHKTVHLQPYKEIYAELTGGKIKKGPVGQISILGMSGRFIENINAGTIFIIEGSVKNEFKETRSAIAVRGILYGQSGKPTMRKKVYCGNILSDEELQTLDIDTIAERLDNQFGDSLSNLDVSPGVELPYVIVFGKLPDNLAEFNVEVAESAPGSDE